jgi:hypothetical protein
MGPPGLEYGLTTRFAAWKLRREGKRRHAAEMTVEQAVDQMQVARAAASHAHRELAGQVSLGTGGKRARFLVTHLDPVSASQAPQSIGEAVERAAHNAVDSLYADLLEGLGHESGNDSGPG